MDGTVRIWNLNTGQCIHTLTGHTSLVGLLGLSPTHLVSAAADSTLRIWDPNTGELQHTLAAHTGAITCFQHDEFKVLSGSDGTLKMWDVRDGSVVKDLLTGITGVWQVVFEGRWCVAASNRMDSTVLDVWDFGNPEDDPEWVGEPSNGLYDDSADEEDEEDEQADADADAMDEDLKIASANAFGLDDAPGFESTDGDLVEWEALTPNELRRERSPLRHQWPRSERSTPGPSTSSHSRTHSEASTSDGEEPGQRSTVLSVSRTAPGLLPLNETPTRPRGRSLSGRRQWR